MKPSQKQIVWISLLTVALPLLGCANKDSELSNLFNSLGAPSPAEIARDAFNIYDADLRRNSIAMLSSASFGGEETYLRLYRLLIDDPDSTVRSSCVRALGRHGTGEDIGVIMNLLDSDPAPIVRWESARALQKIHDIRVIGPLIEVVGHDEDADVRIAAAYALGQYAEPRVFYALVGALDDQDFGVVKTSQYSLQTLSGQDMNSDGRSWQAWAKKNHKRLFVDQRQYVWWPYEKTRGFIDKAKFWNEPEPIEPRLPRSSIARSLTDHPTTN